MKVIIQRTWKVRKLNQNKEKLQKTKKKWQLLTLQRFQNLLVKIIILAFKNGLTKFRKQKMQMVEMQQECSKQSYTFFKELQENETNDYYSDAQILDQFITGLKDKLIKKVCLHAPEDQITAIRHTKTMKWQ
ncbi:hypothetical protein G9A89_018088 [Geosiphon pyriformis]|nr:hypothetical protein G9A89_018088 [Geosiphon pyriformis]